MNLSQLLKDLAETKADSIQTIQNWSNTVKDQSLRPYTRQNLDLNLEKQGPTQVYQNLLVQEVEDNQKTYFKQNALYLGACVTTLVSFAKAHYYKPSQIIYTEAKRKLGQNLIRGVGLIIAAALAITGYFTSQRNDVSDLKAQDII